MGPSVTSLVQKKEVTSAFATVLLGAGSPVGAGSSGGPNAHQ